MSRKEEEKEEQTLFVSTFSLCSTGVMDAFLVCPTDWRPSTTLEMQSASGDINLHWVGVCGIPSLNFSWK